MGEAPEPWREWKTELEAQQTNLVCVYVCVCVCVYVSLCAFLYVSLYVTYMLYVPV